MLQPPLPHTITGNVSFLGNASSAAGRYTCNPGEPNAGSDVTWYGPGSAFGAPSRGKAREIMSRVTPAGCARHAPVPARNAAAATTMVFRIVRLLRTEFYQIEILDVPAKLLGICTRSTSEGSAAAG